MIFNKKIIASAVIALAVCTGAYAGQKVALNTTEGRIVIELDEQKAPKTCANFLNYAKEGFYNNTIFHRVIPGFMIQGGGFTASMQQKKTHAPIPLEAKNGLKNNVGTVAMARTNDPNSATSQFFINVKDNDFLNASASNDGYAVFGHVVSGMDTVRKIVRQPTTSKGFHDDVPVRPIEIKSVEILK